MIVCFNSACTGEIDVDTQNKVVLKDDKQLFYEGDLVYGAIFSSSELYECQIKRLMKITSELAHLYAEKSDFLTVRGCSSNLGNDLRIYASLVQGVENSRQLSTVVEPASEEIRKKNDRLICELF